MTEDNNVAQSAAKAVVKTKRRFSFVWVVPIVALVIGAGLAYKAISEKGPTITITFATSEGLEAGKTKVKYKDVEIGTVESIDLNEDLSNVVVTAQLKKGVEKFLTDKTRFWVVRAQIRGGTVSGLTTVLSGAYIGIDPHGGGTPTHSFKGLEIPPVITSGLPGRHFWLHADQLGSLDVGAPVYYRQIQVGQVVSYGFSKDGKSVDIQIFIEAPYHLQVTENTRFWNASGVDITLNAEGLKVNTESMVSIITGGIAFDLPKDTLAGKEADEGAFFNLYPTQESIQERIYTIRRYWMLRFDQTVRGLTVGAPVELYGIKIGEVIHLDLEYSQNNHSFYVPVIVAIEPERIRNVAQKANTEFSDDPEGLLRLLVEQRGLRAQLKSGNLLTGQLTIDLVFQPNAKKVKLTHVDGYPLVPTIPAPLAQLQESIERITSSLEKIPFEQIGVDLQKTLQEATVAIKQAGVFADKLNSETAPELKATLVKLQATLDGLNQAYGKDSSVNYSLQSTLDELTLALRSLRELSTTLNNQPQSLFFGKEGETRE